MVIRISKNTGVQRRCLSLLLFLFAVGGPISGCSTWRKLDDTEKGAVIGGGTGAVVGNAVSGSTAGTLIGGAAGAVGGGLIGREVERDKRR